LYFQEEIVLLTLLTPLACNDFCSYIVTLTKKFETAKGGSKLRGKIEAFKDEQSLLKGVFQLLPSTFAAQGKMSPCRERDFAAG